MRIGIYVLLGGVLALCLWTVFAVGVALIPLIPLDIPPKIASNLNQIALNLSYSFIAAFVFFILTAVVPYLWTKKSLGSAIQIKRLNINRIIRDLLFHFAKGTEYSATDGVQDDLICEKILKSKNWNDNVPDFARYSSVLIPYYKLFGIYKDNLQNEVHDYIIRYGSYISPKEIETLEKVLNVPFWRNMQNICNLTPVSIDIPNGRDSLVSEFLAIPRLMKTL